MSRSWQPTTCYFWCFIHLILNSRRRKKERKRMQSTTYDTHILLPSMPLISCAILDLGVNLSFSLRLLNPTELAEILQKIHSSGSLYITRVSQEQNKKITLFGLCNGNMRVGGKPTILEHYCSKIFSFGIVAPGKKSMLQSNISLSLFSLSLSFSRTLKTKNEFSPIEPCNMWYTLTFLVYLILHYPMPFYSTLFHPIPFQSISLHKTVDLLNNQLDFVLSPSLAAWVRSHC